MLLVTLDQCWQMVQCGFAYVGPIFVYYRLIHVLAQRKANVEIIFGPMFNQYVKDIEETLVQCHI